MANVRQALPEQLPAAEKLMRQVLDADLGGYQARWHTDLDDLEGAYLRRPGCALFVARIGTSLVGTAAVRPCALTSPPNPPWLVREYNHPDVCQLVRVWVAASARRRGTGRALVRFAVAWALESGGYRRVYLHTDAGVPGAEWFWRRIGAREVHDERQTGLDPSTGEFGSTVHFEMGPRRQPPPG